MEKESSSYKIRLSLKGDLPKTVKLSDQSKNHVLTITASMSLSELQNKARELFGVSSSSKSCSHVHVQLYSGFPPKLITTELPSKGDNVIVQFVESETNAKSTGRGKKRSHPSTSSSSSSSSSSQTASTSSICGGGERRTQRRTQRTAAKIASASFKDVIKEQDAILKHEKSKNAATNKRKITSIHSAGSNKNNLASSSTTRAAAANSRRLAKLPGGRRLADDTNETQEITTTSSTSHSASSALSSSSIKSKKVMSIFQGIKSEEDVSFALLSCINTPSSGKKINKVLRSAMRRTVEKSYEASRAIVRCSAVVANNVSFIPTSTGTSDGGTCNDLGSFTVRYPKGVEGIGYYEDEHIHILSIEMLTAVIHSVFVSSDQQEQQQQQQHQHHQQQQQQKQEEEDVNSYDDNNDSGKEMLRPNHMAQLSPRVFWSLWFHGKDKNCTSIEESLKLLLPELDWGFLSSRNRQLSEKAKENLRQKKKLDDQKAGKVVVQNKNRNEKEDRISHLEVVKSVEEAMEKMYDTNYVESMRTRSAQAALRRLENANDNTNTKKDGLKWILETPTELDLDELVECVKEAISTKSLENQQSLSSENIYLIAKILSSKCSINNWRMLANANVEEILPHLTHQICDINVDETFVNSILTAAQQRSIDEIMLEILDGDETIFIILREEASAATPMDMTLWQYAPSILLEEVPSLNREELNITNEKIVGWSERAAIALNKYPWMTLYSTSISDSY